MKGYSAEWQTRNQSLFYLFGFIVFLTGFIKNTVLLSLTGLVFITIAYLSKWYVLHMIRSLTIENTDHSLRLSIGDSGDLVIAFVNPSRLPFFNLSGRIVTDPLIAFRTDGDQGNEQSYQFALTLPARKKILVHCPVKALERGIARVRSFELTCADPFHVFSCSIHFNELLKSRLIVYPNPETAHNFTREAPQNIGSQQVFRSLFQDFSSPAGTRDYVSSDPFRHIHWKASARVGRLQTKTYEHVSRQNWTFLFLNAPSHLSNKRSDDFERRISAAAWLTQYAQKHQIDFSLYCNTKTIGRSILGIDPDHGGQHLRSAWEMLAFMQKWQIKTPIQQAMSIIDKKLNGPRVLIIADLDQLDQAHMFLSKWLKDGHLIFKLIPAGKSYRLERIEHKGGVAIV